MFCGLPPPSSAMLTAAERVPIAEGLNLTVIVHPAPAAMLVPQVLTCEKSPELDPMIVIAVKFNCVVPTFFTVML